jgi:hypothetical protein
VRLLYCCFFRQDHTLVNSTRFSEVAVDMEIRLRGLLNLPNAAERQLYELPQIQVASMTATIAAAYAVSWFDARCLSVTEVCSLAEANPVPSADVDEAQARSAGVPQQHLRML